MCGPWAIPVALMLSGSVAKYFGNQKAEKAQWREVNEESARQKRFTNQQQGLFEDSTAKAGKMSDEGEQDRAAGLRDIVLQAAISDAGEGGYLPGSSSAPAIVRTAADTAEAGQKADTSRLATALARMSGTGDLMLETGINNSRNAGRIGQLASFKAGSTGAHDAELRAAAHKGSTLRGLGSLAQQIGMAMAMGNAAGAGGGANAFNAYNGGNAASQTTIRFGANNPFASIPFGP